MMKCLRVDKDGYVVTFGEFDDVPEGMFRVPDETTFNPTHFKKRWDGSKIVETDVPVFGAPTTSMVRAAQYPPIGDQLDALWKALGPLIEHPEAEAMLARILAVKNANPKPSN